MSTNSSAGGAAASAGGKLIYLPGGDKPLWRKEASALLMAAGAAMLAACAEQKGPALLEPKPDPAPANEGVGEKSDLVAPTPKEISLRYTAADDGKTVEMSVGAKFAVELVGTPTAGYLWSPIEPLPANLKLTGEATGPTHADQNKPGFAGGQHWDVTVFEATAPGSATLKMAHKRPWETNEPPADTFTLTIRVK